MPLPFHQKLRLHDSTQSNSDRPMQQRFHYCVESFLSTHGHIIRGLIKALEHEKDAAPWVLTLNLEHGHKMSDCDALDRSATTAHMDKSLHLTTDYWLTKFSICISKRLQGSILGTYI